MTARAPRRRPRCDRGGVGGRCPPEALRGGARRFRRPAPRPSRSRASPCWRRGIRLATPFANGFALRVGVDPLSGFFLGDARCRRRVGVRLLRGLPAGRRPRPGRRRGWRARSCSRWRCVLCARDPLGAARRLGADDRALGRADPRRARRRPAGAADGVRLSRADASRRGGDVGRGPAAREGGRARRPRGDRVRARGSRSRSRWRRCSGWGRRRA